MTDDFDNFTTPDAGPDVRSSAWHAAALRALASADAELTEDAYVAALEQVADADLPGNPDPVAAACARREALDSAARARLGDDFTEEDYLRAFAEVERETGFRY